MEKDKKDTDKAINDLEKLYYHIREYADKNNIEILVFYTVLKDLIDQLENKYPILKEKWNETKKESKDD